MSTVISSSQHYTKSFSQCNKAKKKKDIMERKENLFVDVMILYVENTEESTNKTEKLLE